MRASMGKGFESGASMTLTTSTTSRGKKYVVSDTVNAFYKITLSGTPSDTDVLCLTGVSSVGAQLAPGNWNDLNIKAGDPSRSPVWVTVADQLDGFSVARRDETANQGAIHGIESIQFKDASLCDLDQFWIDYQDYYNQLGPATSITLSADKGIVLAPNGTHQITVKEPLFHDDIKAYFTFGADGNDLVDTLSVEDRPACIYAGSGDDVVKTNGGQVYLDAGNDTLLLSDKGTAIAFGGAGNDILSGGETRDSPTPSYFYGGDGDDTIVGGGGPLEGDPPPARPTFPFFSFRLYGENGNDRLTGSRGNDLLSGGLGNDTLDGGYGADFYSYASGDGNEVIANSDPSGFTDVLQLYSIVEAGNIDSSRVKVTSAGADMVLHIAMGPGVSEQTITLAGQCLGDGRGIEEVQLVDVTWTRQTLDALCMPCHSGRDNQADTLQGTSSADTYCIGRNAGTDTVVDGSVPAAGAPAPVDTILFGQGILSGDVRVERNAANPDDAYLGFSPSIGTSVIVKGQFATLADGAGIERVTFSGDGGVTWSRNGLRGAYLVQHQTGGNDTIFGFDDTGDTLSTGLGDDILDGLAGNDTLQGGAGNDRLYGSAGNDRLEGGDGDDALDGGDGNDAIDGGEGNDILRGQGGADTIAGAGGNDRLEGGDGDDALDGGDGNDTIFGGTGDDRVTGGAGADWVYGDVGNDIVSGGDGDDYLAGHDGDDTLRGDAGADTIDGGAGNDAIDGGEGNDILRGQGGADAIAGAGGNDRLEGGNGDDILQGGAGNDTIYGGSGDDTLVGQDGSDRYVYALGEGRDRLDDIDPDYAVAPDADVLSLTGIRSTDVAVRKVGNDLVLTILGGGEIRLVGQCEGNGRGIESLVFGGDGVTWNRGDIDAKCVAAGTVCPAGAGVHPTAWDSLPVVSGTSDRDRLTGTTASERLDGGAGDDTYVWNPDMGDDVLVDSAGNDTLYLAPGQSVNDICLTRDWSHPDDAIFTVAGHSGSLTIKDCLRFNGMNGSGDRVVETIFPGFDWSQTALSSLTGNDLWLWYRDLASTPGGQRLGTRSGNDQLWDFHQTGPEADNILCSLEGNDAMIGGRGNDTYVFARGYGYDVIDEDAYDYTGINWTPRPLDHDRLSLCGLTPADVAVQMYGAMSFPNLNPGYVSAGNVPKVGIRTSGSSDVVFWDVSRLDAGVETVEFSDGTSWNSRDLAAHVNHAAGGPNWIVGNEGADVMSGTGGADLYWGRPYDDTTLAGDVFVLGANSGHDQVAGMRTGGDHPDVIQISKALATSFAEVSAHMRSDYSWMLEGTTAYSTTLDFGAASLQLWVTRPGDLTAANFSFV